MEKVHTEARGEGPQRRKRERRRRKRSDMEEGFKKERATKENTAFGREGKKN